MSIHEINFGGDLEKFYRKLAEEKGINMPTLISSALALYVWIDRELESAKIECEPNLPWKLSITEPDGKGGSRVVKDISLP